MKNRYFLGAITFLTVMAIYIGFTMYIDSHKEVEQIPFNSHKWKEKVDGSFAYRLGMIDELLYTDTLRYLDKSEIIYLLDTPSRENKNYLYYRVDESTLGLMTLRAKFLVIKLDSIKNQVMIHG